MASIRYRAPWRVMVKGDKAPKGVFVSKTQAEALSATLIKQGIDKESINLVQESKGGWEARVRRQGAPDLVKTFTTKSGADKWATAREGEIAKAEIIDYRAAEKVTFAELCQRYADERYEPKTSEWYRVPAATGSPSMMKPWVSPPAPQKRSTQVTFFILDLLAIRD